MLWAEWAEVQRNLQQFIESVERSLAQNQALPAGSWPIMLLGHVENLQKRLTLSSRQGEGAIG